MKLDKRITLVIVAIISIVAVAGGWVLGVSPQLAAASTADASTSQLADQNSVTLSQLHRLTAAKAKLPEMKSTLTGLQTSIPDTLQATTFLDDLNTIASATGVKITTISIGTVTPYTAPETGPYSDSLVTASNFGTSPVTIAVTGTPDQEFAFLHGVQYGSRLVLVTAVNTSLTAQDTTNTLNVIGTVYVMNAAIAKLAKTS